MEHWIHSELELTSPSALACGWHDLVAFRSRIVADYSTRNRHFLELADCAIARRPSAIPPRTLNLLQQVLGGDAPKVIAAEAECSISTISGQVQRCLADFGLVREVRHVPLLLMLMFRTSQLVDGGRPMAALRKPGPGQPRILNMMRPDACLRERLSPSEYEVVQGLVDGMSHEAIARTRNTSPRTVANQLASAFHKLDVSGRGELMVFLVNHSLVPIAQRAQG